MASSQGGAPLYVDGYVTSGDSQMNVFDFISQDEIDELPEDPRQAFSVFVRTAQRRLAEYTRPLLRSGEQDDYEEVESARYSFANVVLAAGRRLGIEPFASIEVPKLATYRRADYDQFVADLDHYLTQLALDTTFQSRADSVPLPSVSKDRIRSHLHYLREAVEKSDLTDAKKAKLLQQLDDFATAVEKTRVNYLAVARLAVEIMAIPGALWQSYELTQKLVTNIIQTVAEAKAVDDEQRKLPTPPEPYAILPPRQPEVRAPQTDGRQLDDIPF